MSKKKAIFFDWGNTVMIDFSGAFGRMCDWETVQAEQGIREVLHILSPHFLIALATNAQDSDPENIREALRRVDLEKYFEKIYCFQNIGHLKPAKAFFTAIINDLNILVDDIIMVGDDFEKDVLGANSCGIYTVWYNRFTPDYKSGKLYTTIHHLSELTKVIL
jgi:putative hydrolase of the HAD superfamily